MSTDAQNTGNTVGISDFEKTQQSEQFQELKKRHRSFVFPLAIAFLLWYFAYVLLADYAHDFMSTKVIGNVNIGLLELLEGKLRSLLAADPILCHVDTTHVFARELAPLLDISDGKRVGGVRVTHCGCECVVVVWNWVSIARREKFCKVAIR